MQFVVYKEEQITDIKPLPKFGFGMEEKVIRILKNHPGGTIQFGRNVKTYRKQPVTFMMTRS